MSYDYLLLQYAHLFNIYVVCSNFIPLRSVYNVIPLCSSSLSSILYRTFGGGCDLFFDYPALNATLPCFLKFGWRYRWFDFAVCTSVVGVTAVLSFL